MMKLFTPILRICSAYAALCRRLAPGAEALTPPRGLFLALDQPRERQLFKVVEWRFYDVEPTPRAIWPVLGARQRLVVVAAFSAVALVTSLAAFAGWTERGSLRTSSRSWSPGERLPAIALTDTRGGAASVHAQPTRPARHSTQPVEAVEIARENAVGNASGPSKVTSPVPAGDPVISTASVAATRAANPAETEPTRSMGSRRRTGWTAASTSRMFGSTPVGTPSAVEGRPPAAATPPAAVVNGPPPVVTPPPSVVTPPAPAVTPPAPVVSGPPPPVDEPAIVADEPAPVVDAPPPVLPEVPSLPVVPVVPAVPLLPVVPSVSPVPVVGSGSGGGLVVAEPRSSATVVRNPSGVGLFLNDQVGGVYSDYVIDGGGDSSVLLQGSTSGVTLERLHITRTKASPSVSWAAHGMYVKAAGNTFRDVFMDNAGGNGVSGMSVRMRGNVFERTVVRGYTHAVTYYEHDGSAGGPTVFRGGDWSFSGDTAVWGDDSNEPPSPYIKQSFVFENIAVRGPGGASFLRFGSSAFGGGASYRGGGVTIRNCTINGRPVTASDVSGVPSNLLTIN